MPNPSSQRPSCEHEAGRYQPEGLSGMLTGLWLGEALAYTPEESTPELPAGPLFRKALAAACRGTWPQAAALANSPAAWLLAHLPLGCFAEPFRPLPLRSPGVRLYRQEGPLPELAEALVRAVDHMRRTPPGALRMGAALAHHGTFTAGAALGTCLDAVRLLPAFRADRVIAALPSLCGRGLLPGIARTEAAGLREQAPVWMLQALYAVCHKPIVVWRGPLELLAALQPGERYPSTWALCGALCGAHLGADALRDHTKRMPAEQARTLADLVQPGEHDVLRPRRAAVVSVVEPEEP